MSEFQRVSIRPMDEYNQTLVSYAHPPTWVNPRPADCYDLVVIGAGTAGLVAAGGAALLNIGLKVALVEQHLMGGDCLNFGCVPSKSIIRSARVVGEMWSARKFGINAPKYVDVDFSTVMERMRRVRAQISPHDSAERFQKMGVDVFLGSARFASEDTVEVGEKTLRFKKAVIATGARAAQPPITGIEEAGYLTNETVFSLIQKPQRLAVIGGGPIGCELAQTFRRFDCEVTLFHQGNHILNKEDPEAAEIIQKVFDREEIRLVLGGKVQQVEKTKEGKTLYFSNYNGKTDVLTVDDLLVGTGRIPNVEGLNLDAIGVAYDPHQGVKVNDYLQTTNPKIYAAGDICMNWKFTHAADAAARIVIRNALFSPLGLGRQKLSNLVMPWVIYTDPEIAHVGMYEHEAQEKGIDVATIKIPFTDVDRAITDGEEEGFLKILHPKNSDRILGATIVARHAGEMISQLTIAIVNKITLNQLNQVIYPYPTQSEAIKKAADTYYLSKTLTPNFKRLLSWVKQF